MNNRVYFLIIFFFSLLTFLFTSKNIVYADTSTYRPAGWVATDGDPAYSSTAGCQKSNDGLYCSRPEATSFANLYFGSFGKLSDFGIPVNSAITKLHLRIKGKNNIGQYVGVTVGKNVMPFANNCQFPSDLWTTFLSGSDNIVEFHNLTSQNGLNCVNATNIENEQLTFRLNRGASPSWSADIDNFEIAFDYTPPAITPTNTPSPTPTATPTPSVSPTPEPFLDLPWDYRSQGKSFEQTALDPFSWFDHKYPLQNVSCCTFLVLKYNGQEEHDAYRSHSGYDYAVGIKLGTPVLAAGSGWAEFLPEALSAGAGNMIKIDHRNGYQTWYEHLAWYGDRADHGLVVDTVGRKIYVNKGDKIGEVGMTGNTKGPHIHLSVVNDINGNDNFNDEGMCGLMDPLGWEGSTTDPWTTYGAGCAQSYNLFLARAKAVQQPIPVSGGTVSMGQVKVEVPANAAPVFFTVSSNYGPFASEQNRKSIVPSVILDAFDSLNNAITGFSQSIKLSYNYSEADLTNINEDSIKFSYFNEETRTWENMPTTLDKTSKIAVAFTNHFSRFALMGEQKDTKAPHTTIIIQGQNRQERWYRNATIHLSGEDNDGGIGLESTLYRMDDNEWVEYTGPIAVTTEGKHTITYESIDKAYNIEEQQTKEFYIDQTLPVTNASVSGTQGKNGWYRSDVSLSLSAQDNGEVEKTEYAMDSGEYVPYSNAIVMSTEGEHHILYRSVDMAGNMEEAKMISVKIDKSAPDTLVYVSGQKGMDNWYRSNVTVSLNALDSTSGFQKSFYALNGGAFIEYRDPIVISNEGTMKLAYYSIDKAGNKEAEKVIEVKIDKTAPEAEIAYNLSKFDIVVTGKDNFGSTTVTFAKPSALSLVYTITDKAGNKLVINTNKLQIGKEVTQTIRSLQYNANPAFELDRNIFFTFVLTNKTDAVNNLNQYISMKGDKKIYSEYTSQSNTTKIYTKKAGATTYTREEKSGIILLHIVTENGVLKYFY